MAWILFTSAVGILVLALSENLRRRYKLHNELSRKIVHSVHALSIATWPYFVSYKFIIVAELLFLLAVAIAHKNRLFDWLRDVSRKTWGEFFYPVGIIITALLAPQAWIFVVVLLHIGVADSLAAIVGKRYGQKTSFKIFHYNKSVAGMLTFWVVSLAIVSVFTLTHQSYFNESAWSVIIVLPVVLSVLEGLSVWGTDNIVIPLAVLAGLNLFS